MPRLLEETERDERTPGPFVLGLHRKVDESLSDEHAGGRRVALRTRKGERPRSVALRLASALGRGGLNVSVLRNARTARSAFESYDLIVTDKKERPVPIKGSDVGLLAPEIDGAGHVRLK